MLNFRFLNDYKVTTIPSHKQIIERYFLKMWVNWCKKTDFGE